MMMVMELMVGGDEGGEDGLLIPPPGEKFWINLSPKTKIVGVVALCFANSRRRGDARGLIRLKHIFNF